MKNKIYHALGRLFSKISLWFIDRALPERYVVSSKNVNGPVAAPRPITPKPGRTLLK